MVHPKSGMAVTYNGEIYNESSLRAALSPHHEFHTTCDTEVIAPAYRKWGAASFGKLNGMFAIGLWDPAEQTLVLARDPIGIKPLYFSVVGRSLRFASEIKALLTLEDQPKTRDPMALHRFLAQGYPGPDCTLLSDIRMLPPGSILRAGPQGYRIERYWRPTRTGEITDIEEALAAFGELWPQVVEDHLISDVPVGLLLSGGIDSALVAAGLGSHRDVAAFTASFAHRDFDESAAAASVANARGLPHKAVMADAGHDIANRFISVVHHFDGQCADSSSLAFHSVCEAAAAHSKVVLTGDGADEFFGGYETYRASRLAHVAATFMPQRIVQGAASLLAGAGRRSDTRISTSEKLFRWLSGIAAAPDCPHPQWRRYAYPHHFKVIYTRQMRDAVGDTDPLQEYTQAVSENSGTLVDRCLVADQQYYLPGDLLVKSDVMSMAHSLEVRVPFLDVRVMEFAGRLSASLLTPLQGPDKRVLRAALKQYDLPAGVVSGRKRGFNVPIATLLRTELKSIGEAVLRQHSDIFSPHLDPNGIRLLWSEHHDRRANHSYLLWTLLTAATWLSGMRPRNHSLLVA
jgi:asparagine synthase (glutamine-hydrolysing)